VKLEAENGELGVAAKELLVLAWTIADTERVCMFSATGVLELTLCCADMDEIDRLRTTTGTNIHPFGHAL
jgi:hypothetical protein